ncbi:MAG: sulfotransferase domain-containing protein [Pseudomonadota bacterium]
MKSIVWLASYPKSGNTWFRIFLANYIFNQPQPVPINQVHRLGIGDGVAKTYRMVSKGQFDAGDPRSTMAWRDKVLRGIISNGANINFVKTHNENGSAFGARLIPKQFTRSAVYILRDPRDMVISYASHYGVTVDQAIEASTRADNVLPGRGENAFQFLGNWSNHVLGWGRSKDFPVLTLRYEDLKADPHAAFTKAIKHIGLTLDDELLDRSIRFSSFDEVRKQEDQNGFVENSENQQRFFRSGESGQWQSTLSEAQVDTIRKAHGKVMKRYDYL